MLVQVPVAVRGVGSIAPGRVSLQNDVLLQSRSDPKNRELYPGSAMTALCWLQRHRRGGTLDIRVTENHPAICERLRQSLGAGALVKQASFVEKLHWLTERDNLILLVDPFGCVTSFQSAGAGRGLGGGWIDHDIVTDILRRCATKERAVVCIWWGFGQALRAHHKATCDSLANWSRQASTACRLFHDKRNHAIALIGIGGGADAVGAVPRRTNWAASCLADAVYERR